MKAIGKVTYLGKNYRLIEQGYMEYDVNAWVATSDCTVIDNDTGEEVDQEVLDTVIEEIKADNPMFDRQITFFDKLCKLASWEHTYDDYD